MTTKLGVLAKVLAVVVLLAAPAAARNKAQAKAARRERRPIRASVTATAPARLQVCRAKRAEEKATPSIEPEWRTAEPSAPLLARR